MPTMSNRFMEKLIRLVSSSCSSMLSASACAFSAVGVDLQQAVAALLQLRFQRVVLLAAGFDQIVKAVGVSGAAR
jgi:hypothetical protein